MRTATTVSRKGAKLAKNGQSGLMDRARRQNPATVALLPSVQIAKCIGCNCTDAAACDTIIGPCFWIKVDYKAGIGVCSECEHKIEEYETMINRINGAA